jgi:hypothetical protein
MANVALTIRSITTGRLVRPQRHPNNFVLSTRKTLLRNSGVKP